MPLCPYCYSAARSAFGLPACGWRYNTKRSPQSHPNGAKSFCWLVLRIQASYIESNLLLMPYLWLGVRKKVDANEDSTDAVEVSYIIMSLLPTMKAYAYYEGLLLASGHSSESHIV